MNDFMELVLILLGIFILASIYFMATSTDKHDPKRK